MYAAIDTEWRFDLPRC